MNAEPVGVLVERAGAARLLVRLRPSAHAMGSRAAALGAVLRFTVCCLPLIVLVLLPFLLGAWHTPAGYVFYGSLVPSGDESHYLAALRLGAQGDWLWHDPYMAHTPPPLLMYPLYLAAGHLAGVLGLSVRAGYALLHICTVPLLCGVLWRLAALAVPSRDRIWFIAYALGTGGLYCLVAVLAAAGHAPVSLSAMGTFTLSGFTALLMDAHAVVAIAGQIAAFSGLPGLPFLVYYYLVFRSGPRSSGQFQRVPPTPPVDALFQYGALLPLAYWGWRHAPAAARPLASLLGLWIIRRSTLYDQEDHLGIPCICTSQTHPQCSIS